MKTRTLIKNLRHGSLHHSLKSAYMNFGTMGYILSELHLFKKYMENIQFSFFSNCNSEDKQLISTCVISLDTQQT